MGQGSSATLVIKFWVKLKCNSKHSLGTIIASTKGASTLATNGNPYFEALCTYMGQGSNAMLGFKSFEKKIFFKSL